MQFNEHKHGWETALNNFLRKTDSWEHIMFIEEKTFKNNEAMSENADGSVSVFIPCVNCKEETLQASLEERSGVVYLQVSYDSAIVLPQEHILYDSSIVGLTEQKKEITICLDEVIDFEATCHAEYLHGMVIVKLEKKQPKKKKIELTK